MNSVTKYNKLALTCIIVATCLIQARAQLLDFSLFQRLPFKLKSQDNFTIEITFIIAAILVAAKAIIGRRRNKNLAVHYIKELVRTDSAIHRQFAQAEKECIIYGPSIFKFYATGRRYCQGAVFTLRMAPRQDAISLFTNSRQKDVLDIEVNMNENAMPLTVFFVGTQSSWKNVSKDHKDITDLATKRIQEPPKDRLLGWPNNDVNPLVIYNEHSSVFYDVITPVVMDQFFGPNVWPEVRPYFQSLHVSSDFRMDYVSDKAVGTTTKRPVVRLSLTLPKPGNVHVLDKFITLLGLVIDGLGQTKLTPDQHKRAVEVRHKIESTREAAISEKQKRLEQRRLDKEAEERERLAKLPPEQREKERAKKEKILKQRRMKSLVKKF